MLKKLMALFLLAYPLGCLDYQEPIVSTSVNIPIPPSTIAFEKITPDPLHLVTGHIGNDCSAIRFQVPPLQSANSHASFYCLWFFDSELLEQDVIQPQFRTSATVSLSLDKEGLQQKQFRLNRQFYESLHSVRLICADRAFASKESATLSGEGGVSQYYWLLKLNEEC